MNVEEILIRLGVDARAVTSGLQRVGAGIRGWAASLTEDLKGHFGRMFAAGYAIVKGEQFLETIKERIIAIKRAQEELGASSNLVQGLFLEAEKHGLNYESTVKPLMKFSAMLGEAKAGSIEARGKLTQYAIATKD